MAVSPGTLNTSLTAFQSILSSQLYVQVLRSAHSDTSMVDIRLDPSLPPYISRPPTLSTLAAGSSTSSNDNRDIMHPLIRLPRDFRVLGPNDESTTDFEIVTPLGVEGECGICSDGVTVPDALSIPKCNHIYCKICLHFYATMKIRERQYPICCPTCHADGETENCKHQPLLTGIQMVLNSLPFSDIENDIFIQLNMSQREMEILDELQISLHSRILSCPK